METPAPKYRLIANRLMQQIRGGQIRVGDLIPTENELMRAYGVSRSTVRNAVQVLKSMGVVQSRRGSGSRVIGDGSGHQLVEEIYSIRDLVAVGHMTRRELVVSKVVEADDVLADIFSCSPGRRLVEVEMVRRTADATAKPIAFLNLWIDALYEPVVEQLASEQRSVAEILSEWYGCHTGSVMQTIRADLLSDHVASLLGRKAEEAALIVTRRYSTASGIPPHLVARSTFPAQSVKIVLKFSETRSGSGRVPSITGDKATWNE